MHADTWATTLLSRRPFREAELVALRSWTKERGWRVVLDPDGSGAEPFVKLVHAPPAQRAAYLASYPYDVETVSIYHDPSLGIMEDLLPPLPEEWRAIFDPLLYAISAVAAGAAIYGMRSRGRREEEDLEWDEGPQDPPLAEPEPNNEAPVEPAAPPDETSNPTPKPKPVPAIVEEVEEAPRVEWED